MALFPKIARTCPYLDRLDEAMDGDFCRMCNRTVHDLSDMSRAERAAFVAACGGDACVTYTARMSPAAAAAALAASAAVLVAPAPAMAQRHKPRPAHARPVRVAPPQPVYALAGMIAPPPRVEPAQPEKPDDARPRPVAAERRPEPNSE